MKILLEIAVDTLHDAAAAQYGGADRIELCSGLASDGLSPSADLVRAVRAAVTIPMFAMVRPRAGDFCYTDEEFRKMKEEIVRFASLGVNGIVLGILHEDRTINLERTAELIRIARPLSVTFHRAFDSAVDPFGSLERIIDAGADRLLTSGQQKSAADGISLIGQLIKAARGRIRIMPGAGINSTTVNAFLGTMNISEFHSSSGVKGMTENSVTAVLPEKVRELRQRLSVHR